MTMIPALFRTSDAEARFRATFDALLGSWDINYESTWVETQFGQTHVVVAGTEGALPVVLIPGAQGTAGMWGAIAGALAEDRKIYAIDLVDQVGLSRPTGVLSSDEDSNLWLGQVLSGLGLECVDLVGNSLGSFIAGKFASSFPEKVRSLTLTAPAATVSSISLVYILKVLISMNLPIKQLKTRFLVGTSAGLVKTDDPLFQVLQSAMFESRVISRLIPRALRSVEISSWSMPVLLIQGSCDKVNAASATDACDRLKRKLSRLHCETLEGAGHLWSPDHFRSAGEIIRQFLRSAA